MTERSSQLPPWLPGDPGKGVVFADGAMVTWQVDPRGRPTHHDGVARLGRDEDYVALWIDAGGEVEFFGATPDCFADVLASHRPPLKMKVPGDWRLGHRRSTHLARARARLVLGDPLLLLSRQLDDDKPSGCPRRHEDGLDQARTHGVQATTHTHTHTSTSCAAPRRRVGQRRRSCLKQGRAPPLAAEARSGVG